MFETSVLYSGLLPNEVVRPSSIGIMRHSIKNTASFLPLVASDATTKFDEGTREYSRHGDLPNNFHLLWTEAYSSNG